MNYYNEHDKHAAAWIRELIAEGLIAPGEVDERSIVDVEPEDVRGFSQCHWFAGIGGWSASLRLAGWSDSRPVWSASLPCQPFSAAGQQKGGSDDRHLWPVFARLVRERRPQRIFGEQVAQAIGFNWLDGVSADLEAEGYAVGATVLGAHSVGAPHRRQRLYWMAIAGGEGAGRNARASCSAEGGVCFEGNTDGVLSDPPCTRCATGRMAVSQSDELKWCVKNGDTPGISGLDHSATHRLGDATGERCGEAGRGCGRPAQRAGDTGESIGLGDTESGECRDASLASGSGHAEPACGAGLERVDNSASSRCEQEGNRNNPAGGNHWSNFAVIPCRDGKLRRVPPLSQPGLQPLAARIPGRVALLRGAGNAICVPTAAAFIRAAMTL